MSSPLTPGPSPSSGGDGSSTVRGHPRSPDQDPVRPLVPAGREGKGVGVSASSRGRNISATLRTLRSVEGGGLSTDRRAGSSRPADDANAGDVKLVDWMS